MLAVSLLTQNLHCPLVYALSSSSPTLLLTIFRHSLASSLLPLFSRLSFSAANKKQQPVDAAVLHLVPSHRQLLCAQHVCGRGGGKLSQVSAAAGGGGGAAEGGETTETVGEKEEK